MNQTFTDPVQKIDALLTRALGVPAEVSSQFCEQLNGVPEESQKVALEMIGKKTLQVKQEKEKTLQKIRSINNQMKLKLENVSKSQAETKLEDALKNI